MATIDRQDAEELIRKSIKDTYGLDLGDYDRHELRGLIENVKAYQRLSGKMFLLDFAD